MRARFRCGGTKSSGTARKCASTALIDIAMAHDRDLALSRSGPAPRREPRRRAHLRGKHSLPPELRPCYGSCWKPCHAGIPCSDVELGPCPVAEIDLIKARLDHDRDAAGFRNRGGRFPRTFAGDGVNSGPPPRDASAAATHSACTLPSALSARNPASSSQNAANAFIMAVPDKMEGNAGAAHGSGT